MPPCAPDGGATKAGERMVADVARGSTRKDSKLKTITHEELLRHNKPDDNWICIDDKVYDVSKWAASHPGGEHLMHNAAGTDASAVFHAFHTKHGSGDRAHNILKYLPHVANMEQRTKSKLETAFHELRERLDSDGLYDTDFRYYHLMALWLASLLLSTVYLVLTAETKLGAIGAAFVFGLFLQQCAFVGHDTAHNGITHDRKTDMLIGIVVGPLLTGVSTAWWKRSHNAHHVVTNSVTHDPDIQHMPIIAISPEFWSKGGVWSLYHKKWFAFDWAAKALISYQHYLFYPVMAFARWNLYVQGFILLFDPSIKTEWTSLELGSLAFFWTWLSLLTSCLPTLQMQLLFLVVSHMFAGILHVQITLSHFSMPVYHGATYDAPKGEEFLRQQCATSMDVDTQWWNDWFHGGLQFQVAHHIFPRVPRHNLKRVQTMLQGLCHEHGVEYKCVGWLEGNREIYKTLHSAAMKARESPTVEFTESEMWKAMCAEG
uniref:Cytochrome b5 heme-binding domain-containing protein n=1 Tax=Hemiselmis tepida TaxID=464990 RepID=A0A7S0W2B0_9CRYP|mmetsp:Transcript_29006/g.73482  ORF Transcript_29006/g.73482 Transcript_29006/m.73482 type:complete len:488 (+) Transcript_29006:219-1682(+)